MPVTSKSGRDYLRVLFAGASDEIAGQAGPHHRPAASLRAYAGLTKDCVVIGANTRVEIWDAEAWATYEAAQEANFSDIAEEVLPGVL